MDFEFDEIAGWCAGTKMSNVTGNSVIGWKIEDLIGHAVDENGASVITVSVNEQELAAIAWLKRNGFKKGPWMKNWGHSGRRTCLYFYQIKKRAWSNERGEYYFD